MPRNADALARVEERLLEVRELVSAYDRRSHGKSGHGRSGIGQAFHRGPRPDWVPSSDLDAATILPAGFGELPLDLVEALTGGQPTWAWGKDEGDQHARVVGVVVVRNGRRVYRELTPEASAAISDAFQMQREALAKALGRDGNDR